MDKFADHSDREHAHYAPSAMTRILACTDSLNASKGIKEETNSYAEEGTECHEAAANILGGMSWDVATADLSDDQIWIVEEYVNYCLDLSEKLHDKFDNVKIWIEERVYSDISDDYHGTGDFTAWAGRTVGIVDLKAGFAPVLVRDPVTGKINEQLGSYGILTLDTHKLWDKVDRVRLTIVQPRVYDKPQTVVVPIEELRQFKRRVANTIDRIERGDTKRVAGPHCKYCPATGRCDTLRKQAVAKAMIAFDEPPKAPRDYKPEELEAILDEAELIAAHIEGIRSHVRRELEKGRKFNKWKLVQKRAMAKWIDFDKTVDALLYAGMTDTMPAFNLRPKTPLQLKKELKKQGIDFDLATYFVKESSGATLARMDDPREATKSDPFPDDEE